jgi:rhodanese-related sulfurtransferase
METISPAEVHHRMQYCSQFDLIDVRTPAEFDQVHAAGARLVPLTELDPAAVALPGAGEEGAVYVICHSGSRAATACQRLLDAGLTEVYCVEGGTEAWVKEGLPVIRGASRVLPMERQVRIAAGSLVLLGVILAWTVHPGFIVLSGLVGAGLIFAGVSGYCGMAIVLGKMPWNAR